MKTFKKEIRSSRKWVTFNGKQFFTTTEASEIIKEANNILNQL